MKQLVFLAVIVVSALCAQSQVFSQDEAAKPSHWIKLAGPACTGRKPILSGIAALADEPCKLSDVVVETTEWGELLEIQR